MGPRIYPLAPATWGEGVELPVDNVVQAPLFNDFAGMAGMAHEEVLLQPNPLSGSWRVRLLGASIDDQESAQGRVIGEIDPYYRERFTDMRRVDASLLMPKTSATVAWDEAAGQFAVRVLLPPPLLAVPRNDAPDDTLTLPSGEMLVVDTSMGEYTREEITARSPGQWLVALHHIGSLVAITLGPKLLGAIRGDEATQLISYMQATHTDSQVPQLYARAVLLQGMAALDVAEPSEDNPAYPVQQLKVPDVRLAKPWSLIEFPDDTWGVSVERDHVADPGDYLHPKHTARYVSLAGIERPDSVAPTTEEFERVQVAKPQPQPVSQPVPEPQHPEPVERTDSAPEDAAPEDSAPEDTAPEDAAPEDVVPEEAVQEPAPESPSQTEAVPEPEPDDEPEIGFTPETELVPEPEFVPQVDFSQEFSVESLLASASVPKLAPEPELEPDHEPENQDDEEFFIDLDDPNLSEVEKVRLRRKQREREGGGRHRR